MLSTAERYHHDVLKACRDLHMIKNGSYEPGEETKAEIIAVLKRCLDNWQVGRPEELLFDACVHSLIRAALDEHCETGQAQVPVFKLVEGAPICMHRIKGPDCPFFEKRGYQREEWQGLCCYDLGDGVCGPAITLFTSGEVNLKVWRHRP